MYNLNVIVHFFLNKTKYIHVMACKNRNLICPPLTPKRLPTPALE